MERNSCRHHGSTWSDDIPQKCDSVAKNVAENLISPRSHGCANVQNQHAASNGSSSCQSQRVISVRRGFSCHSHGRGKNPVVIRTILHFLELFWQIHKWERIHFQKKSAPIHVCRKALNKNLLISQLSTMMSVCENVSSQPSLAKRLSCACKFSSLFITVNSHMSAPSGAPRAKRLNKLPAFTCEWHLTEKRKRDGWAQRCNAFHL